MSINLDAEHASDPTQWSKLQTDVCMKIARGKLDAFSDEAYRLAEMVRYGLLDLRTAADCLQEAATYNRLVFEYGQERIQSILAAAFSEAA